MKYKKGKLWKIPTLVVCAVLFGLLAADISGSYVTAPIDVAAYHILRSFESSAATGFFKIMTNMVHPVVLLVISLSMIHILKQRKYFIALLGNLILTVLLNVAIKGSFRRCILLWRVVIAFRVDMPWWQRHFMDFLHICLSRQT